MMYSTMYDVLGIKKQHYLKRSIRSIICEYVVCLCLQQGACECMSVESPSRVNVQCVYVCMRDREREKRCVNKVDGTLSPVFV